MADEPPGEHGIAARPEEPEPAILVEDDKPLKGTPSRGLPLSTLAIIDAYKAQVAAIEVDKADLRARLDLRERSESDLRDELRKVDAKLSRLEEVDIGSSRSESWALIWTLVGNVTLGVAGALRWPYTFLGYGVGVVASVAGLTFLLQAIRNRRPRP